MPWQHPDSYSALHLYIIRLHRRDQAQPSARCSSAQGRRDPRERHYIPVTQPYFARSVLIRAFSEAERYYEEAITLPLFSALTNDEQDAVVAALERSSREDRCHPGARRQQADPAQEHSHVCGKPIIAYSIAAAQPTGLFDEIVVSTR